MFCDLETIDTNWNCICFLHYIVDSAGDDLLFQDHLGKIRKEKEILERIPVVEMTKILRKTPSRPWTL